MHVYRDGTGNEVLSPSQGNNPGQAERQQGYNPGKSSNPDMNQAGRSNKGPGWSQTGQEGQLGKLGQENPVCRLDSLTFWIYSHFYL